jgi:chromosome segregation ATPase
MDKEFEVTLTSPAKINGKHEPAGKTLTVSKKVRDQLFASGAIKSENPDPSDVVSSDASQAEPDFEARVQAQAKELGERIVGAAVDEAVTELRDALQAANKRADDANKRADDAEWRAGEAETELQALRDQVAAANAQTSKDEGDDQDTQPASKAAAPKPKSGTKTTSKTTPEAD